VLGTPQLDAFVSRSFTAIVTTVRKDGSPSSSMVSYARDGDRLYFSTTTARLKGRTLQRDPRLALCVINDQEPNGYVSVEGTVVIHRDNPQELHERMFQYWDAFGDQYPKSPLRMMGREAIAALLVKPGRAIFEVMPTRVSGVLL